MSEYPPDQPPGPPQYPQTGGFAAPPPPYQPPPPPPPQQAPPPQYPPADPNQGYACPPTAQQPAYTYPPTTAPVPPVGTPPPSPFDQPGSKRSSGPLVLVALLALLIGGGVGYFVGSSGDDGTVDIESASAEFEDQIDELAETNADLAEQLAEAEATIAELEGGGGDDDTTTQGDETTTTEDSGAEPAGSASEAVDSFCARVDDIVDAIEGGATLPELTDELTELGEEAGSLGTLTDFTSADASRLGECSTRLSDAVFDAPSG